MKKTPPNLIPKISNLNSSSWRLVNAFQRKPRGGNKTLVSSVRTALVSSVALLALVSVASAQTSEWIGTNGSSLVDPENWTGESPSDHFYIDYIKLHSGLNATTVTHTYTSLGWLNEHLKLNEIGYGAGGNAHVTINLNALEGSMDNVSIQSTLQWSGPMPSVLIGGAGGTGTVTLQLGAERSGLFIFPTGMSVGHGAGGLGTVNVLGIGKNAPHAQTFVNHITAYGLAFGSPTDGSDIDYSYVGSDGGTGVINIKGSGLGPLDGSASGLRIGHGAGSTGTVNVFSNGKIASSMKSANSQFLNNESAPGVWDPLAQIQVGVAGGTGTLNIDASSGIFQNGLLLGEGTGATGTVNLLGGGKGHSNVNVASWNCPPVGSCLSDTSPDDATWDMIQEGASVKVGVNNGTGALNVSGAGSIWYASGAYIGLHEYFSSGPTKTAERAGQLYIGYTGNGALTIGDQGVVKIGTGTVEEFLDITTYLYSYLLQPDTFISNGTLYLAHYAGSKGALNIGAAPGQAPVAPGTLEAGKIVFGAGSGAINFNHTSLNYEFDPTLSGDVYGFGDINAMAGRTILNKDLPNFTGTLTASTGILQVNGNFAHNATTVLSGGLLEGIGTIGSVTNAGVLAPGLDGNAIGLLTIAGNYIGSGGYLAIDTVLGDSSSVTDQLVIQGNVSGSTSVVVTNAGGLGAQTTGDGIKIIEINGTSPDGSFALAGNYVTASGQQAVIGGAYAYALYHNGVSAADGNWYLRSETMSTGPGPGPGSILYQPLVPVAEAYPRVLMPFMQSETLEQRTSHRQWGNLSSAGTALSDSNSQYIWARMKGGHTSLQPSHSATRSDLNYNYWSLKSGFDAMIFEKGDQALLAGVNIQYGQTAASIKSFYGNGKIDTTGYGLGTTLTWYGPNGFYVDSQAQATWFDSDLSSNLIGRLTSGNNGFGYSLSLEGGKKFVLNNLWSITPQLQLSYASVDFDRFNQDRFGVPTDIDKGEELVGRFGVAAEYQQTWTGAKGDLQRIRVYGMGNVYYDFINKTRVDVDGIKVAQENESLWGGGGLGGAYNWDNDKYSLYGEATVKTSFENSSDNYDVSGQIGFRIKW